MEMSRKKIVPQGSPTPLAPYSPGIRVGDTIYVSGVLAVDAGGNTVHSGDVAAQTKHVIETIKSILEAEGATLNEIAFNAIFLKDLADYKAMNQVYAEYFGESLPARYCIRADLVRPEFLVEIASTAHLRK